MYFKIITEEEIMNIVKNLKNKHSSGYDNIPTSIIKLFINEIITPLTHAIISSFKSGIFPDALKIATVKPLYKKRNMSEIENYRPISLLPSFSKIFEKCLSDRLMNYFIRNDLLHKNQHAYLKGRGTHTAIFEFTEKIIQALEDKNHVMGLFLDLTKAYDCVNHEILLRKLKLYNTVMFDSSSLQWDFAMLTSL